MPVNLGITEKTRVVSWFSCGFNSAVASMLVLEEYVDCEVVIARCVVDNEHIDNERFCIECEEWYERPILRLRSEEYKDCWEVWEKKRYLSGINGAPCTTEMKKAVRWAFEKAWNPHFQVFGFSIDEKKRADDFAKNNPDVRLLTPLIDNKFTSDDCAQIIDAIGIKTPMLYKLGFPHNNCVGCVKSSSPEYWGKIRLYFPEQFNRMVFLSRYVKCRLVKYKGKRIYLDELPKEFTGHDKVSSSGSCGILCEGR